MVTDPPEVCREQKREREWQEIHLQLIGNKIADGVILLALSKSSLWAEERDHLQQIPCMAAN
jgi:hypothetical protein